MTPRRGPFNPLVYTVAWLCALPEVEAPAAMTMLDNHHEDPTPFLNGSDKNFYVYGDLSGHNVVIASMPVDMPGKISAQLLVTPLRRSFPNLRLSLFVGIGGGVPRRPQTDDATTDIHLGDVVVGWGVGPGVPSIIEYDYVRWLEQNEHELLGIVDKPNRTLVNYLTPFVQSRNLAKRPRFRENLSRLGQKPGYQYPGLHHDVLFTADYKHHREHGQLAPDCTQCDESKHSARPTRENSDTFFHRGTILSGDSVMMNAEHRDTLSRKYHDAKVFEMEAAAVMSETHSLVIRGISDYADSHKPQGWRGYAAATAAAFAHDFLSNMRPEVVDQIPTGMLGTYIDSSQSSTSNYDEGSYPENRCIEGPRDTSPRADFEHPQDGVEGLSDSVSEGVALTIDSLYNSANEAWKSRRGFDHPKQALDQALEKLEEGIKLMEASDISNPELQTKLYFRILQVEREITFHFKELDEKNTHLNLAETYGRQAMNAARRTTNPLKMAHVELEMAYTQGRKMQLMEKRLGHTALDAKAGKSSAVKAINKALLQVKNLDPDLYEKNKKYAESYWIRHLSEG